MIGTFYNASAGCRLHSAAVIAYALSRGVRAVQPSPARHPAGRRLRSFRSLDLARLSQYFRACMVDFNQRLARNMLQWDHLRFQRGRFGTHPCRLFQNP
jgi:hypothetical protein